MDGEYQCVSEFYRVQNGAQIDVHYRGQRDGEPIREITAYSCVPESEIGDLLSSLNSGRLEPDRE